jgi:hypothetical protein
MFQEFGTYKQPRSRSCGRHGMPPRTRRWRSSAKELWVEIARPLNARHASRQDRLMDWQGAFMVRAKAAYTKSYWVNAPQTATKPVRDFLGRDRA